MRSGFENRSISSCHFSIQRDAPTQCTRCPGNASLPDMPSPWGSGASACQRERWCNVKSPKCKNTGDCSFKCHPPLDFQGLPCLQWTLNWNRWSWFQRKASRPSISLTSSRKLQVGLWKQDGWRAFQTTRAGSLGGLNQKAISVDSWCFDKNGCLRRRFLFLRRLFLLGLVHRFHKAWTRQRKSLLWESQSPPNMYGSQNHQKKN